MALLAVLVEAGSSVKKLARAYAGGGEVCQVCHRAEKPDGGLICGWQTCRIMRSAKVCQVCRRRVGAQGGMVPTWTR